MNKKVKKWRDRIEKAEKKYQSYYDLIKEIREYYKNEKNNKKQNIFWSSIETLKPFLYFKQPRPYVEREDKKINAISSCACKILEKAIAWDMRQFDFDSVIKYARNDFLLAGTGIAWEQYVPQFSSVRNDNGAFLEVKTGEVVKTIYVDPVRFLVDVENVGIWEDAEWVARIIPMTKREAADTFEMKIDSFMDTPAEKDAEKKEINVYEIWDKKKKKIYYLAKEVKDKFLRETDDVLKLNGFFPCPKPIFATMTNDSLIPVPDYSEIKEQLAELDGINERMRLTIKALKVSGAYDGSFPELANILEKDVALVALNDFQKLKDAGGLDGIVNFMQIDQYISALQALAQRRSDLMAQIYEITGVSDIMRGNANPQETATAVNQKTNFGTLRNQDRQNDMQRFLCDLFKIKAEIICELFSRETLAQFADESDDMKVIENAVALLKQDKLRGMTLGVEIDTALKQDADGKKAIEAVKAINDMIQIAMPIVSQQPLLLPLYRQMIGSITATLPEARQFENVIEQCFSQIEKQLSQPSEPEPNPDMLKVQNDQQKNQQEFEIKKEQNAIKQGELALKQQIEQTKVALTEKEMDLQAALREQELRQRGEANTNIATGFVRSFE